ncbi:MAG: hypothetical protein ACP5TZ_00175 [Nitrososphaeria archaeon]
MTGWPEDNKPVNEVVDVFVSTDLLVGQEKQLKYTFGKVYKRPF